MAILKKFLESFTSWLGFKRRRTSLIKRPKLKKNSRRRIVKKKIITRKKVASKKVLKLLPVKKTKAVTKVVEKEKPEKSILVGRITHYFSKIQVVVVKVLSPLKSGDLIRIQGKETNFAQKIDSMQVESVDVKAAKKGQLIGLKVAKEARVGDEVFLIK